MNVDRGYRSSSYFAYVEKRSRKANLEVQSGVTVRRLVFEHNRAVAVEVEQHGRALRVAVEGEVILSAGAIGSPQLLLLSGIGPADDLRRIGIEPVQHLSGVGGNLHDHFELDLQWECKQPITVNGLLRPHKVAAIGLQWLLFRSGFAAGNQCHVGAFLRSGPSISHPDIQLHFFPLCFEGWVPRRDVHGFRVAAGAMRQTSRGRLSLRSSDPRDPPLLDPNYLATEQDRKELRESYAVVQEIVSQPAFDAYRGPPLEAGIMPTDCGEIDALARRLGASSFHLCGTCRMGSNKDPQTVVDPQTRVLGLSGLRVADASIMPSIVSSNLNAATIMIGERAADLIRGRSLPPMRPD